MSSAANNFTATDPATGEVVWSGAAAGAQEIDRAIVRARGALEDWSNLPHEQREAFICAFAEQVQRRREDLVIAICRSTGKPKWEANTEVDAVIGKGTLTIQAYRERRATIEKVTGDVTSATRFKPHGVLAVFGPFNFPAHLP